MLLPTLIFLSTYSHGPLSLMGCGAHLMGTIFMVLWNNHMNLASDVSPQDGKLSWFVVLLFEMHEGRRQAFKSTNTWDESALLKKKEKSSVH